MHAVHMATTTLLVLGIAFVVIGLFVAGSLPIAALGLASVLASGLLGLAGARASGAAG